MVRTVYVKWRYTVSVKIETNELSVSEENRESLTRFEQERLETGSGVAYAT